MSGGQTEVNYEMEHTDRKETSNGKEANRHLRVMDIRSFAKVHSHSPSYL